MNRFADLTESEIYPRVLPHLILDRPLVIYGRVENLSQTVAFQILGQSAGKVHDIVFKMNFNEAKPGSADIRTQWAWHKAHHLIGDHILSKNDRILDQLEDLSDDYRIHIPYSSKIAPRF